MTIDEKQIIIALNSFLSSPTVNYIEKRFRRLYEPITVKGITEIKEDELFESLDELKAVEFIKFQTQLKENGRN